MTKKQFTKLATELGYSCNYSGKDKTFYLKGSITQNMEDPDIQQKSLDLLSSGFTIVYQ